MNYYCEICHKTIKLNSKNNHLKSFTHIQYEKAIQIIQTIENPSFFNVDKIFNDFITNHTTRFDFYLFKCDFKLDFDNDFKPRIKTDFYYNTIIINLKRHLLYWIDYFSYRRHKFSHINQMINKTIGDKRNMNYENYIKEPMEMAELNLNMFIAKNPHLIISPDRTFNHSLIRKYSKISFNS